MVDLLILIDQLDDWSVCMLSKLARVNDVNTIMCHLTLEYSFHSHEYGKNYS